MKNKVRSSLSMRKEDINRDNLHEEAIKGGGERELYLLITRVGFSSSSEFSPNSKSHIG